MSFSFLHDPLSLKHSLFSHPDKVTSIPLKDVRSCVLHTFSDGSFNSKILHHISFLLVNEVIHLNANCFLATPKNGSAGKCCPARLEMRRGK